MQNNVMACLLALLAVVVTGCTATSAPPPPPSHGVAPASSTAVPPPVQGRSAPPGTLLSSRPVTDPAPELERIGARVSQITYASRSGLDGSPVVVSGVVIVPPGDPPPGGWPVVSYAHGTTGLADMCAPSGLPRLGFQLDAVLPLVEAGYLVTATDYEGLGTPGPHPYLYPRSEARSVIDAVRAARALEPAASARWVAVGPSQGGQAAWAAAELADDWAPELQFLGSVALAPPVDLATLADEVPAGLSSAEQALYAAILTSLQLRHPELDVSDYLSGPALELLPVLQRRCLPAVVRATPPTGYAPSSLVAIQRLRARLAAFTLPQQPAAGPMFVAAAGRDDLVPVDVVSAGVERACELGDVIEYRVYPDAGHPALPAAGDDTLGWIAARFAGEPAPNTC